MTDTGDAISQAQRDALAKLAPALAPDVYLAGGAGFAAYLRHRVQIRRDFETWVQALVRDSAP